MIRTLSEGSVEVEVVSEVLACLTVGNMLGQVAVALDAGELDQLVDELILARDTLMRVVPAT